MKLKLTTHRVLTIVLIIIKTILYFIATVVLLTIIYIAYHTAHLFIEEPDPITFYTHSIIGFIALLVIIMAYIKEELEERSDDHKR